MYFKIKKQTKLYESFLGIAFTIYQINKDIIHALTPTGCIQYSLKLPNNIWHGITTDVELIFEGDIPNPNFQYKTKRKGDIGYRLKTNSKSTLNYKILERLKDIESIHLKEFNGLLNYDPYVCKGSKILFYPEYLPIECDVYIGFKEYVMDTYTPPSELIEVTYSEYSGVRNNLKGVGEQVLSSYFREACMYLYSRKSISIQNIINRLNVPTFEAIGICYGFMDHGLARYNKNTMFFDLVELPLEQYEKKVDKVLSDYYTISILNKKDI